MVSTITLCKKLLNVKNIVIENTNWLTDFSGTNHLTIHARPSLRHIDDCPICHKRCMRYDEKSSQPRKWRGLDYGGTMVEVSYKTHRIECPEHGVLVADVPWAYPGSGFTKEFDLTVGWLAKYLPRNAVSELMRIDWKTVGRCIHRTLNDLEPERAKRLNNLENIGIDETSYKKGHKYITVVVNHDNNTVVWAAQGHGKTVLESFYKELSEEQLNSIKVVTADGAKWIKECVEEYTPKCVRCVDPFHVVEWAMEALEKVRREVWHDAYSEFKNFKRCFKRTRGRPQKDDSVSQQINEFKEKVNEIKHAKFALGKAPENLTDSQRLRVDIIAESNPRLYRAYQLKETLRLILKEPNAEVAEEELTRWLWRASHSRITEFKELYLKIKRHKDNILNAIIFQKSNARVEAINNKIKLIIRKAYGFRNINNMLDFVYLVCSDIKIPLPGRIQKAT